MDDGFHRFRLADSPRRDGPALFLDRDGTLIEDPGYISDPDDVRLIDGVTGALRRFRDAGYALVVVTNQSGIGRGLYGWDDYEAVAARLDDLLAAEGIVLDADVRLRPCAGGGHRCGWRKPAPGMILAAAERLGLDLGRSLLAGDKRLDIEAAAAAGLPRAAHVATGQGRAERGKVAGARFALDLDLVDDLSGLVPMRLLIVKLSSFGDVIHTFPAITDLKAARPDIEVDWLVEEGFAPFVALHPGVAKIHTLAFRRLRKPATPLAARLPRRHGVSAVRSGPATTTSSSTCRG